MKLNEIEKGALIVKEEKELTGYPSIDKPWLKYYSGESINKPLPKGTIYEYLWENNKEHLDDVAINYYDRMITYKELFGNINKAANAFSAIGVHTGDIVIMTTVTTPEMIYAFYALNRLGAISNMVDARTSTDGIRQYIREGDTKYILTIEAALPKIKKAIEGTKVSDIIVISPSDSLPIIKKTKYNISQLFKKLQNDWSGNCLKWREFLNKGRDETFVPASYVTNTCCVIVHTGGTTGIPKGVMLSNDNLNIMVMQYRYLGVDINRTQKFLDVMPPFIAYGVVLGIHMPLCLGLMDVLVPQFDPSKLADLIIKYKPAHMAAVPMHYQQLCTNSIISNFDLSFLQMTGCGGDGIAEEVEITINNFLKAHNCKFPITKGYGMTEISSAAATNKKELNKIGSVGIPHLKTTISIFEVGTDKELQYGECGEVCVCAPTVMLGYYQNIEETQRLLSRHRDGKIWVHSGDIGYMDEDGFLFINGRIKNMIIRSDGHNVWPAQIENVILKYHGIKECAVVGIPDKDNKVGKIPTAFIVLADKSAGTRELEKQIDLFCKKWLPERDCALAYYFIEKLPLTPIGKVDYLELEKGIKE